MRVSTIRYAVIGTISIAFLLLAVSSLGDDWATLPVTDIVTSMPVELPTPSLLQTSPLIPFRWVDVLWKNLSKGVLHKSESSVSDQNRHCEEMRELAVKEYFPTLPTPLQAALRGQISLYESVKNGTAPPDQKYLVWSLSGGLGNRFQSLGSSFVAALLSGRVLLLKDWFTPLPPNIKGAKGVIYPSNRSSDYVLEHLDKLFDDKGSGWPANEMLLCSVFPFSSLRDFRKMYPSQFLTKTQPRVSESHIKIDIGARHDKRLVRWNQFLCTNLTHSLFNARFVYIWTNQYYLPAFFANPYTRKRMLEWFPNGPYSTVVKLIALPALPAARQVVAFIQQVKVLKPLTYVSLQIRAFQVSGFSSLASSFSQCLQDGRDPFFLATMHAPILQQLKKSHGSRVVTRKAPEHEQGTGKDFTKDIDAFVDMLIMAFGGRLYISHGSTFGGFVAALADFMPIRVRKEGVCEPLPSPEPCFSSWFRYDKIAHRKSELSCSINEIPKDAMFCQ